MKAEIDKMLDILSEFLGEPKSRNTGETYQFQFGCPRCIERDGENECGKYNLELNLQMSVYQCWKCSSSGDDDMHGKIRKLFKLYGNEKLWNEYKECLESIRSSELYKIHFNKDDFKSNDEEELKDDLDFPDTFVKFERSKPESNEMALSYLTERGIGWDIIEKYKIGYTLWDKNYPMMSNRIIIPSFNEYGELNYWVGRDFKGNSFQKYCNPKVEKKDIIFNENLINWDADINICEGVFDAMAIGINAVPLLGKALTKEFKIYNKLFERANADINVFVDGDAKETAFKIYKTLNQGRLYNRIRYVPIQEEYDPGDIYRMYGKKGIIEYLKNSVKIKEIYL